MTIENLQLKVESQQTLIKQLTDENEQLYQQFNHLMVRNNKLLKRMDDLQQIINDLHIRIEELQLINGNMLRISDNARRWESGKWEMGHEASRVETPSTVGVKIDLENVFKSWKTFPGQGSKNSPNLRKQVEMLLHLYEQKSLPAAMLFSKTGVNGVTGARYVGILKKSSLIKYVGARKKGFYQITQQGVDLIEKGKNEGGSRSVEEIHS